VVTAEVVRRLKANEDVGTWTDDLAEDGSHNGPPFVRDTLCMKCPVLVLPAGIKSIGASTTGPTIGDESEAFVGCDALSAITLPAGLTCIGKAAFGRCTSLSTIALPDSLVSICHMAFNHCTSITSISLPEGLVSIGEEAFMGCSSLASITIPDSVTVIGDHAFMYCPHLDAASRERIQAVNANASFSTTSTMP
jgi:hypothetical protein